VRNLSCDRGKFFQQRGFVLVQPRQLKISRKIEILEFPKDHALRTAERIRNDRYADAHRRFFYQLLGINAYLPHLREL
jgi:hypothetical protein